MNLSEKVHLIEQSEMMVLPYRRDYIRYSFGKDERCWSSNLQISFAENLKSFLHKMYLENCIPNEKLYKYFIIRHPRY